MSGAGEAGNPGLKASESGRGAEDNLSRFLLFMTGMQSLKSRLLAMRENWKKDG